MAMQQNGIGRYPNGGDEEDDRVFQARLQDIQRGLNVFGIDGPNVSRRWTGAGRGKPRVVEEEEEPVSIQQPRRLTPFERSRIGTARALASTDTEPEVYFRPPQNFGQKGSPAEANVANPISEAPVSETSSGRQQSSSRAGFSGSGTPYASTTRGNQASYSHAGLAKSVGGAQARPSMEESFDRSESVTRGPFKAKSSEANTAMKLGSGFSGSGSAPNDFEHLPPAPERNPKVQPPPPADVKTDIRRGPPIPAGMRVQRLPPGLANPMAAANRCGVPAAGKKKKMNGYLLFALHKKKQREQESGEKMKESTDEILKMFDSEWRVSCY